ncbi:hypothetical protein B9T27_03735 [Acinetobacter sp. ANC 4648]|nr:hypothetical protein B9T27_03735 [Acinetobacter sp. ANC 4648]
MIIKNFWKFICDYGINSRPIYQMLFVNNFTRNFDGGYLKIRTYVVTLLWVPERVENADIWRPNPKL